MGYTDNKLNRRKSEKLELANLQFFEYFRKVYIGDQSPKGVYQVWKSDAEKTHREPSGCQQSFLAWSTRNFSFRFFQKIFFRTVQSFDTIQIDWLIDWSIDRSIDWSIDSGLIDRLIDWMKVDWLIDWLIDCSLLASFRLMFFWKCIIFFFITLLYNFLNLVQVMKAELGIDDELVVMSIMIRKM